MIKKKFHPESLDELKFAFLERCDTQTVDVSVDELKQLVKRSANGGTDEFAEKFAECLDDGSERVSFDKL